MMVTSVTDPDIVGTPAAFTSRGCGGLAFYLKQIAHNHYVACDQKGVIRDALRKCIAEAPPAWKQMLDTAFCREDRVVRVPMSTRTGSDAGTPQSLQCLVRALADERGVDIAVLAADERGVPSHDGHNPSQVTTLDQYPLTAAAGRDDFAKGAQPLGGMKEAEFLSRVIEPVIRWASKVSLIDPWIGPSLFKCSNHRSWAHFKRTVTAIYGCWQRCALVARRSFEIITCPVRNVDVDRSKYGDMLAGDFNLQAKCVGQGLHLGPDGVVRVIKSWDPRIKEDTHDRYLVTNRNVTLAFTKGFDLIESSDAPLASSSVSLYPSRSGQVLHAVLSSRAIGSWPTETQSPAFAAAFGSMSSQLDRIQIAKT